MKTFELEEGCELRGFEIRLYPTAEQVERLLDIADRQRVVWNDQVRQSEDARFARAAFVEKRGLVPSRPVPPQLPTPESKEEKAAVEAAWKAFRQASGEWWGQAMRAADKIPECAYRKIKEQCEHFGTKQPYQMFNSLLRGVGREPLHAHVGQALEKRLYSLGTKRRKRQGDKVSVQVRSGECFELGDFGMRRGAPFYDCQVKIAGMKIRGRLPKRPPEGKIVQGVTVRQEADGWYGSIRTQRPVRALPEPTPGSIVGVDVGLINIAAFSDGRVFAADQALQERIDGRAAMKKDTGRLRQKQARAGKHVLYNILKALEPYETIVMEELPADIGQRGTTRLSHMRRLAELAKQRFGERVREVNPSFTSQECSQCGLRAKDSWSCEHGRFGKCPQCGYSADRDVNAARNLVRRYLESLTAEAA